MKSKILKTLVALWCSIGLVFSGSLAAHASEPVIVSPVASDKVFLRETLRDANACNVKRNANESPIRGAGDSFCFSTLQSRALLSMHSKESCYRQYDQDAKKCRKAPGGARGRAVCWAAITIKLGTCIAGANS